jgi:photosystem II stability/assembly factor-like uncharacterized protein
MPKWILFLLFIPCSLSAQTWTQIYPELPLSDINCLAHWNGDTVFAAGYNWTVMRSVDRGETWEVIIQNDHNIDIRQMFTAGDEMIVLATSGRPSKALGDSLQYIYYSFNPWTNSMVQRTLQREYASLSSHLDFIYTGRYLMVLEESHKNQGAIHISSDGGRNWGSLLLSDTVNGYRNGRILFLDQYDGYYVARSNQNPAKRNLYQTSNGGVRWSIIPGIELSDYEIVWSTIHPGHENAFAVTSGQKFVITSDGGKNWTQYDTVPWSSGTNISPRALSFFNDGTGFVVGEHGSVYQTRNFGADWTQLREGLSRHIPKSISAVIKDQNEIIINDLNGSMFRSDNAGSDWVAVLELPWQSFDNLHFLDTDEGFLLASNSADDERALLHTSNGGVDWSPISSFGKNGRGAIRYPSENMFHYLHTDDAGNDSTQYLLTSSDKGQSWVQKQTWTKTEMVAWHLQSLSDEIIYIVDSKEGLRKSSDGGTSWSTESAIREITDTSYTRSFKMFENGTGWLLTRKKLFRTTDDGRSWSIAFHAPYTVEYLSDLDFTSDGDIMIHSKSKYIPTEVFRGDVIYRSTNDGISWMDYESAVELVNYTHYVSGNRTSYSISDDFVLHRSYDLWRSASTQLDYASPTAGFGEVFFLDENNGWVLADRVIFRTSNGGTSWIRATPVSASGFLIHDAYPNPARAGQSIHFSYENVSGVQSYFTANVYNTLGEFVATLFAGNSSPGLHNFSWDTATLQPGMYFVRMSGREEMQVKTVLLR